MEKLIKEFFTWFIRGVGLFSALALCTAITALIAQSINIFSSGGVVSASAINTNFRIAAPEGAVMGFYLSACPNGWIAADGTNNTPDLRGSFIRGLDNFGTAAGAIGYDPDGTRALGNFQSDSFQGHYHPTRMQNAGVLFADGIVYSGADWTFTPNNAAPTGPAIDGGHGTPRVSDETRPKNIALLYCMRKDT